MGVEKVRAVAGLRNRAARFVGAVRVVVVFVLTLIVVVIEYVGDVLALDFGVVLLAFRTARVYRSLAVSWPARRLFLSAE